MTTQGETCGNKIQKGPQIHGSHFMLLSGQQLIEWLAGRVSLLLQPSFHLRLCVSQHGEVQLH